MVIDDRITVCFLSLLKTVQILIMMRDTEGGCGLWEEAGEKVSVLMRMSTPRNTEIVSSKILLEILSHGS